MAINVDMKINRLPRARDKEVKGDILKETCYFFRLFIVKKGKVTQYQSGRSNFTSRCVIFAAVTTVLQYYSTLIIH